MGKSIVVLGWPGLGKKPYLKNKRKKGWGRESSDKVLA
jgi:hypothetical protein